MSTHHEYILARGTAVQFTSGEYSDFGTCGFIVTIQEFNLGEVIKKYQEETNKKRVPYKDDIHGFPSWLVANGYAMPGEVEEIHLGSYGEFR